MGHLPPAPFGRVLTAMVTPFHDDGRLDLEGAQVLARWLVAHGSEGLVVNGTTGEAPALTNDETLELFRAVREAVDVPLVAGSGSNNTGHAIRQSQAAEAIGYDALLVVTPYYNRPSQAGLERHFRMVCESVDTPVVLYDIPGRTGRKIDTDVIVRLAHDLDNVVALKDAAGSPAETSRVVAEAPEGFAVYSGDDALTLPLLSVGAVGVIGVATHWAGLEMRAMIEAMDEGDVSLARRIHQRLLPSFTFESTVPAPNPVPTKAMMRVIGQPAGPCRPPMGPCPEGLEAEAKALYAALHG